MVMSDIRRSKNTRGGFSFWKFRGRVCCKWYSHSYLYYSKNHRGYFRIVWYSHRRLRLYIAKTTWGGVLM